MSPKDYELSAIIKAALLILVRYLEMAVQTFSTIFTSPGDRLLGLSCDEDPQGELNARLLQHIKSTDSDTPPPSSPEELSGVYAQHKESVAAFTEAIAENCAVEKPSQEVGLTYRDAQKLCLETMPDNLRNAIFEKILSEWENETAPENEAVLKNETAPKKMRPIAADRIRKCYYGKGSYLDLSALRLTSLPECLFFCSGLRELNCSKNSLTALSNNLPLGLHKLNCKLNQLSALPELPSGLHVLNCSNNHLPTLPDELPSHLIELLCWNNRLLVLSDLPPGLRKLSCGNNQLETLPESLFQLGSDCTVDIFPNLLPEAVLQRLKELDEDPQRPKVVYD